MRRPNGCGTVTKMSGTRRKPYAVRVPARDRKGRVVQKYLSYHATQREALDALDRYRAGAAAPAPDALGVTLGEVYETWSARKFARAKPASVASYKASWGRVRRFQAMEIRKLGIDQWQSILDEDERQGASRSTISNDTLLMRALSQFALQRDWIAKDYTQFLTIPAGAPKREKDAFTDAELNQLRQLAADGFPGADAALVLCYTGFRISELLALTCASYDPAARTLTGGMKTRAGTGRVVPVHPQIQPYIDRWLAAAGDRLYTHHGQPVRAAYYRTVLFAPVAAALGRPQATPHWCRHTLATRLHTAGADKLCTKRLLGHADTDITDGYTHTDLAALRRTLLLIP